jgi:hypothetical protein
MKEWTSRAGLEPEIATSKLSTDSYVIQFGQGEKIGLVTHIFDRNIRHDWPSTVPNADNELP